MILDPIARLNAFRDIDTHSLEVYLKILKMTQNCIQSQDTKDWNNRDIQQVEQVLKERELVPNVLDVSSVPSVLTY